MNDKNQQKELSTRRLTNRLDPNAAARSRYKSKESVASQKARAFSVKHRRVTGQSGL